MTLGGNIVDEECVPDEYFIPEEEVKKWEYEKGAKRFNRVAKNGHEYVYSEVQWLSRITLTDLHELL